MERLTRKRVNGIKTGYWSPSKKQDLVDRLSEYEDTGLTPEQIRQIDDLYAEKCREVPALRIGRRYREMVGGDAGGNIEGYSGTVLRDAGGNQGSPGSD